MWKTLFLAPSLPPAPPPLSLSLWGRNC